MASITRTANPIRSFQIKFWTAPSEAHKKYIDLQYILSGEEQTGYASVSDCTVTVPYDEAADYLLVEGKGSDVKVCAVSFYIAFPCDAHKPMCSKNPADIRKVIVKIVL